ncbi:MAG: response regulator [Candidatus Zixiibacteriota bacterium]
MPILVVDDDPVSLKLLVGILEKHDYKVVPKPSAREALTYLQKGEPADLIISDVMMPRIDGFQLLRLVRSDRRLKRIPVILCTTLNDTASVVQGRGLGATDYIVKPIKPEVVVAKVEKALQTAPGPILVVDDQEVVRKLLAKIIEREGFEVVAAASGAEALEQTEKRNVSMVFADIKMPDMTGLELLAALKKKLPSVPVLLMTGYGAEFCKEDLLAAGAGGFITKPFHNTLIISKIEALTTARHTESPTSDDGESAPPNDTPAP